jgi:hypothetical protein
MKDQIKIQLSARQVDDGFDMLAINAGVAKGHNLNFSAAVLKDSLPLWGNVPCMLDHPGLFDNPSVRDLAGSLTNPTWNETDQGIQARLTPDGPAADVLMRLRDAAKSNPTIMNAVGFSAVLNVKYKSDGEVQSINSVSSVDCVINPARGGRFLSKGVSNMDDETNQVPDDSDQETAALLTAQTAKKKAEGKANTAAESLRQVRLQTCRDLLKVSLQASGLPSPSAMRVENKFNLQLGKGEPFEPADLDAAIAEEQSLLSALTAAGVIKGPGRISNMHTSADQLEAAVSDLFGVERDTRLTSVQPARLTGIRELYLMLTGDYDLHGGFYGERIQLATTTDFSGLVKNALNKVVSQQWEALGKAGYDWWEKIVKIEHFTSLNDITGVLVGTVGSLPTVAEGGEYTELAIGDSPETASFTKYGGYIPLTLELIDRDETRKLKAYASELGSAARRKISGLIAAVFTANSAVGPTMADTGALFNNTAVTTLGGHANLLTTAIGTDYVAWNAIALAMYNQPMLIKQAAGYYGTGPKMAVWPKYCLVPAALRAAAEALFIPRWASAVPSIATIGGPSWGGFVEPITVPEWTDATDYAAVIDPAIAPAIIVGERFGIKPEIFTAGNELSPAVFMNDEHRIKVRLFTAVLVQDFRPLHKSNVA